MRGLVIGPALRVRRLIRTLVKEPSTSEGLAIGAWLRTYRGLVRAGPDCDPG